MSRIFVCVLVIVSLCMCACSDDAGSGQSVDTSTQTDTNTQDITIPTDSSQQDTTPNTDSENEDIRTNDESSTDLNDGTETDDTTLADDASADIEESDTQNLDATDTSPPDPQAPACTIIGPVNGSALDFREDWTFIAQASDPEDGPLTGASIVWNSNLAGVIGNGETLIVQLAPGGDHVITCTVVDSDGKTGQDNLTVTVLSPIAEIWHPGDGETRPAANAIPFTGRGFDLEDGQTPGNSLVWTSSIDGQFGTGEDFSATLSAGTNVVTLTVTDSDGNTSTTSITLTMTP